MRACAATCYKVPDSGIRPALGWRMSLSHSFPARPRESRPAPGIEFVALRYGFFYGPGTWYTRKGDIGDQVRQQQIPIIGEGQGVYSFVHIDDAAAATAAALECPPGAYNVVDGNPSPQHLWLTAFARAAGAPAPPRVSEEEALRTSGPDAVYYATRLRGASNEKAGRELEFRPRPLEWI
jgi:2-alkyl-3-oxoalkanoate reductase